MKAVVTIILALIGLAATAQANGNACAPQPQACVLGIFYPYASDITAYAVELRVGDQVISEGPPHTMYSTETINQLKAWAADLKKSGVCAVIIDQLK
jgi:hypothetical protein